MINKREIICIVCPKGCKISVDTDSINDEKKSDKITGNQCKRGEEYAICEFSNPERMLTTTVRVKGEEHRMLPVRSSRPLPKARLMDCMRALKNVEVERPVSGGQVIVSKILEMDADIIASKDLF